MAAVIEINDPHELAGCRLAADRLLNDTPHASFFQTVDWLEAYWRHFGEDEKLRVLVAKAAEQTIGIVPLVVRTVASRLGPLRVLSYPLAHQGGWHGPLGVSRAATWALAMRHLAQTPRDWDMIDLPGVDHHGADRGRTLNAINRLVGASSLEPSHAVLSIDLTDGYDRYLASRNVEFRCKLRHAQRKSEESGTVEFVRHRPAPLRDGDGDPRWDLYDACEQIARKSGQADSLEGCPFGNSSRHGFWRDAHAAAARQGAVDLCLMKIDSRPVAYAYNYHRDGRLFGLQTGCHERFVSNGVDKAMTAWMLQDSCRRGDALLELGEGDAAFTNAWRTSVAQSWRVRHARPGSLRGRVLQWRHSLTRRLSTAG